MGLNEQQTIKGLAFLTVLFMFTSLALAARMPAANVAYDETLRECSRRAEAMENTTVSCLAQSYVWAEKLQYCERDLSFCGNDSKP